MLESIPSIEMLQAASSLESASSSSLVFRLPTLLVARELAADPGLELGAELAGEDCLERAFLDIVLPLSRARRRRSSCMVAFSAVANLYRHSVFGLQD